MRYKVLIALFLGLSLFFGYRAYIGYTAGSAAEEIFDSLAEQISHQPAAGTADLTPAAERPGAAGAASATEAPHSKGESPVWTPNDKYGALFEQNEDMIGWIAIDGTAINYPVMHTPDRKDFYLSRNFEKESCNYGVPYVAENCSVSPPGDNIVIYGHNMKNGAMFAALENYKSKEFYEEHPVIRFDTRAGFGLYEIVAAFKVYPADFDYHLFADAAGQAEFDEYIRRCKELSFYDIGVTAEYGDKLISLSTCEYTQQDNRLVVVAKFTKEV